MPCKWRVRGTRFGAVQGTRCLTACLILTRAPIVTLYLSNPHPHPEPLNLTLALLRSLPLMLIPTPNLPLPKPRTRPPTLILKLSLSPTLTPTLALTLTLTCSANLQTGQSTANAPARTSCSSLMGDAFVLRVRSPRVTTQRRASASTRMPCKMRFRSGLFRGTQGREVA